ncbi:alpha/beta fold hydrolase [Virgibacillus senegalensis]|uniref:alpha/beta fold hydrolase n=1 Tax=Virgibacillus senegalensis TaxID=1499679 RepID=UPI00069D1A18|nr:alpha/beta fold hydrolase [Virgibacillus senegalensis]
MVLHISDLEASFISNETYKDNKEEIKHIVNGKKVKWKTIETITDKDTGLHGYVLQNPETEEVVISFRGTELPTTTTKQVEQKYVGSPSQDARLAGAGGGAKLKDGNLVYETKDTDFSEFAKDVKEDVEGIVLGNSNYSKKEYRKTPYIASPSQDAALLAGTAKLNPHDKSITYTNKNQFTEADTIVNKYVKQFGANNITFVGHSLGGGLAQYYAVKYDSHAITFAAADVFDLLSDENQKRALNGEFKDNIISYTYPDDSVGTYYKNSVGSVYYMGDPAPGVWGLSSHGIKNYMDNSMYDENGYFLPSLLYDEKIQDQLTMSPLALKNSGVSDFPIRIQASLMDSYVTELKDSEHQIAVTRKAVTHFLDDYLATMTELKSKYINMVGYGEYDKLNSSHVEEAFRDLTEIGPEGIPMLLEIDELEDLLAKLQRSHLDKGDIAYNMEKMSKDFTQVDQLLAQWLKIQ